VIELAVTWTCGLLVGVVVGIVSMRQQIAEMTRRCERLEERAEASFNRWLEMLKRLDERDERMMDRLQARNLAELEGVRQMREIVTPQPVETDPDWENPSFSDRPQVPEYEAD
jgi:hypothetical protein